MLWARGLLRAFSILGSIVGGGGEGEVVFEDCIVRHRLHTQRVDLLLALARPRSGMASARCAMI